MPLSRVSADTSASGAFLQETDILAVLLGQPVPRVHGNLSGWETHRTATPSIVPIQRGCPEEAAMGPCRTGRRHPGHRRRSREHRSPVRPGGHRRMRSRTAMCRSSIGWLSDHSSFLSKPWLAVIFEYRGRSEMLTSRSRSLCARVTRPRRAPRPTTHHPAPDSVLVEQLVGRPVLLRDIGRVMHGVSIPGARESTMPRSAPRGRREFRESQVRHAAPRGWPGPSRSCRTPRGC